MPTVQVILNGEARTTLHQTFDYPLVLQFGEGKSYHQARWVIVSHHRHFPAWKLSEIRVDSGLLSVLIDGPEGFRSGPYAATLIRGFYPAGKHCSILHFDTEAGTMQGVTITTIEGTLIIDAFAPDTGGCAPDA